MDGLVEKAPKRVLRRRAGMRTGGKSGARRRRAADYWRKNRDRPCFFPGCRPGAGIFFFSPEVAQYDKADTFRRRADKIKSKTFL